MFELTDFQKVSPEHRPIVKTRPIESIPVQSYGAADEDDFPYPRSKFEEGEILSYFRTKRISRTWIQYWMGLQAALLFLQLLLFTEVSMNSSMYAATVHEACNGKEAVQGSCKSRLWQRRVDEEYKFDGSSFRRFDDVIEKKFTTAVWASDSIQLSVIADPPSLHVPYEMVLRRGAVDGAYPSKTYYEYRSTGVQPVVIRESNETSRAAAATVHSLSQEPIEWGISLQLAKYASHLSHRGGQHEWIEKELKSVRLIVNEMIGAESFVLREKAPMCDVEKSWNSIMMTSLSFGSDRLSLIKKILALSILASAIVTFLLWTWYSGRRIGEGLNGLKFHYLVAAKTILQDLPLQGIVLWYICTWYEGGGGERCQLCLLDFRHCEKLSPFHFSNFILVALLLASSVSNQFLFGADPTQIKSEDDQIFVSFVRVMLISLMILPFSTAMVAFNGSLIQIPGFFHAVFLLPCFAGFVALFSLLCLPLTALIDDTDEHFLVY